MYNLFMYVLIATMNVLEGINLCSFFKYNIHTVKENMKNMNEFIKFELFSINKMRELRLVNLCLYPLEGCISPSLVF